LRAGDLDGLDCFLTLERGRVGFGRSDAGRDGTVVVRRGGKVTRNARNGNGVTGVAGVVAISFPIHTMTKIIYTNYGFIW